MTSRGPDLNSTDLLRDLKAAVERRSEELAGLLCCENAACTFLSEASHRVWTCDTSERV